MAGSVNKVILVGNLGKDPETRTFANGGKVVSFSVATSENCKGSKVYLEGQLETRKWQDQSGNDRYTTDVVLRNFNSSMVLLDGRGEGGGGGGRGGQDEGFGGGGGRPQSRPQPAAFDTDLDDDVPF